MVTNTVVQRADSVIKPCVRTMRTPHCIYQLGSVLGHHIYGHALREITQIKEASDDGHSYMEEEESDSDRGINS